MRLPLYVPPAIIMLLSIPLFLKKVPRNPLYGLRTEDTMSSDDKWYSANRTAGAGGFIGGALWLVAVLVLPRFGMPIGYVTAVGLGSVFLGIVVAVNIVD